MTGLFITFEGGEGSGKTTQINRLAQTLVSQGHKVVTTREPGGTPEAEKIRNFIVQREGGDWSVMAECLLLYAARIMHVEQSIKPSRAEGQIVISDRFTDSTFAYQGYGRGMELSHIKALDDVVLGGFKPDLTFILDIDPKVGLARSDRRLASENLDVRQTEDRFERMGLEFHKKIRQGFLEIAKKDSGRCYVIDATQDIEIIAEIIKRKVLERLS